MISPIDESVGLICDGCNDPAPDVISARCRPFLLTSPGRRPYLDDGEWAFCGVCDRLFQAGDWDGLIERAQGRHPPTTHAWIRDVLTALRRNLIKD